MCVNVLIKHTKKYKYLQEERIVRKNCKQTLPLCYSANSKCLRDKHQYVATLPHGAESQTETNANINRLTAAEIRFLRSAEGNN